MIAVVDASVVVKWLLQDPERGADTEKATDLMEKVTNGEQLVIQPGHWILEVGAVLARVSPETAADDVMLLAALELRKCLSPFCLHGSNSSERYHEIRYAGSS